MSQTSIEPLQLRGLMAAWCRTYGKSHLPTQLQDPVSPPSSIGREVGDALAAWQRWHMPSAGTGFTPSEWVWYAVLERARVESLASEHLPGMARNLSQLETLAPADQAMARLYRVARRIFGGQPCDTGILLDRKRKSPDRIWFRPSLEWLRLPWLPVSVMQEAELTDTRLNDSNVIEALTTARGLIKDGLAFAEALCPLIRALDAHYASGRQGSSQDSTRLEAAKQETETESDEERPDAEIERPGNLQEEIAFSEAFPDYAVFSRASDEEFSAVRWYRDTDAVALKSLDTFDRQRVRQLAHRLQRRLLAARQRSWSFDQEEGLLDSRKLARLVGAKPSQKVFRVENDAPVPEACVILLVDQSGSMRGARRQMAALAIDLAIHTLEICQVSSEVLGYTTRFSSGNPISQGWHKAGCPRPAGRLNALRHILYKTAEQPWRRARPRLGLLLREGFGHENIDGEALHWAARRLMHQPHERKILIVLSDGAPYDKDTVDANGRGFLEKHLREVIDEIESSPIQLSAIGTGQDVGRFYRHAVTVRRPEAVADALFERLGELLTQVRPNGDSL